MHLVENYMVLKLKCCMVHSWLELPETIKIGNRPFCRKKLFSFLKSPRADAQGIYVLRKGDAVCTGNVSS